MEAMTLNDIINDLLLLVSFIIYFICSLAKLLLKNIKTLIAPSSLLHKNVENEIVLITGAACGIGKLLAKRFIQLNSIVICVDIDEHELNKTIEEIKNELKLMNQSTNKRIHGYKVDVSSYEQIKMLIKHVNKEVGNISILINNAGIAYGKSLIDLNETEIKRTFEVNIFSQFWLCKEVLPSMIEKNKGHIVNMSSFMGIIGGSKLTDYSSSKFAVTGFTESLRIELKTLNSNNQIHVSTVHPLHVRTNMFQLAPIKHFKFAGISLDADYAADKIVDGILLDKEIIYIPRALNIITSICKAIQITEFNDYVNMSVAVEMIDKKKN